MDFLNEQERTFLGAVSELAHCNPFLPERIDLERSVLGPEFLESEPVWSMQVDDPKKPRANSWRVHEHVESLVDLLRQRLLKGVPIGHQLDVGPHHVTHLSRSGEILSHRIAADPHLVRLLVMHNSGEIIAGRSPLRLQLSHHPV